MDPAMEFALNILNIEFAAECIEDGNDIPDLLFVDIITEKNADGSGIMSDHIELV